MAPKYWRVTFKADGKVRAVVPLKGPGHARWVVVEAPDREAAERKAMNVYCARKKRERGLKLKSEGKCACGRPLDFAVIPKGAHAGKVYAKCATCRERMVQVWRPNHAARIENGTVGQGIAERDEGARVALNLERQRDRRGEIRLETLVEVRAAWIKARNVGLFGKWLEGEISALAAKGAA